MRRPVPLVAVLLLLLALPAAGKPSDRKEVEELITSYFRAPSDAERARIRKALEERGPPSPKERKALRKLCLALAREGPRSKGGHERTLQTGPVRGKYLVVGSTSGRKGLFIGLHGGGPGAGDARTAESKWSAAAGKNCLCVFPQATRLVHDAWNQEDQEKFVLAVIEELKRTYSIDTNRIYLAGHSMGGYGTWSIGGNHADLFAAISPNSGGVYGIKAIGRGTLDLAKGVLPNLYHLPVKWFHGLDDRQCPIENDLLAEKILTRYHEQYPDGYEFEFEKVPGLGHGIVREGLGPTISWLTRRKRNPYPKTVIWEPNRSYKKDFYWLHVPRVTRGVLIVARIEKKRRIVVSSSGYLPKLSLFLSDELVDAGKEITVTWNGKERFRGRLAPSAAVLAESVYTRRDPAMVFSYRIDLEWLR